MGKKTSTVDEAINIDECYFNIIFDKNIKHDPYLKLSAKNALIKRGYEFDISGVKQFQRDESINDTGKIGLKEVIILCKCFDPDTQQTIYNHIEELKKVIRKEEMKEKISDIIMSITLIFFIIMGVYGTYTFFMKILDYIIQL